MKIAIEGMDGVGKSTIAKMVSEKYGMIYIEKPLKEMFDLEKVDGLNVLTEISKKLYEEDSEIIKAWFFGLGNIYTFLKYKESDLIIDRHFVSNYFWNGSKQTDIIFNNMIELIGKPDITILLYASIETRMQRLYNRNPNDYDLMDEEKHVFGYDKMLYFLNKYDIPFIVVNTENKTCCEVFDEICNIIDDLKKSHVPQLIKL